MADDLKPNFNPNATIQIELDQVQLVDPNADTRHVPPPLPGQVTPSAAAGPARASRLRTIAYAVMVVVFVAAAIAAGLAVGLGIPRK